MRAEDMGEFRRLIGDALGFYRRDVSDFAMTVWWSACRPFELEQVSKALTAHAMDPERGAFAPMPSDIVRQLQGTQTDRSLLAWGRVHEAARSIGAYTSVAFDDGAIHAAIEDMGGWPKLCRSTMDELPHVQRRFCDSHRAYSRREGATHPPYLPGVHEVENRAAGHRVQPPVLIGDPDRARRVIADGIAGPRLVVTPMVALRVQKLGGRHEVRRDHD